MIFSANLFLWSNVIVSADDFAVETRSNAHLWVQTCIILSSPTRIAGSRTYLKSTEDARVLHALVCGQLPEASAEDVKVPEYLKNKKKINEGLRVKSSFVHDSHFVDSWSND